MADLNRLNDNQQTTITSQSAKNFNKTFPIYEDLFHLLEEFELDANSELNTLSNLTRECDKLILVTFNNNNNNNNHNNIIDKINAIREQLEKWFQRLKEIGSNKPSQFEQQMSELSQTFQQFHIILDTLEQQINSTVSELYPSLSESSSTTTPPTPKQQQTSKQAVGPKITLLSGPTLRKQNSTSSVSSNDSENNNEATSKSPSENFKRQSIDIQDEKANDSNAKPKSQPPATTWIQFKNIFKVKLKIIL